MARRGPNAFRRNDAIRALRSTVTEACKPQAMMEVIVNADGTVAYRVYGDSAAQVPTPNSASAKAWEEEIQKLKPKALKGR